MTIFPRIGIKLSHKISVAKLIKIFYGYLILARLLILL